MDQHPTVFVVDEGRATRRSLSRLAESMDLAVETFASAEEYLETFVPSRPGCLVLEVQLPGLGGLDLLDALAEEDACPPAIVLSACGEVPTVVRAMRAGAFDFVEKPWDDAVLRQVVAAALERDAENRRKRRRTAGIRRRMDRLTPGELDVLKLLVEGKSNKAMAARLELSVRAIEVRRAKVMRKMQARSLAELVRWVLAVGDGFGRPRAVAQGTA